MNNSGSSCNNQTDAEETYSSLYKKLGSHQGVHKELRAREEAQRERKLRLVELSRKDERQRLEWRQIERRMRTNGPFRKQNQVERTNNSSMKLPKLRRESTEFMDERDEDINPHQAEIDHAMRKAVATKEVSLQWKGLERLPPDIKNNPWIRESLIEKLLLIGNEIRELPCWDACSFQNLRLLDLSNNRLEHLPSNLGNHQSIEELKVRSNILSSLPASITDLTRMKYLDISDNDIGTLPPEFGSLRCLEELHAQRNNILNLPRTFHKLQSLRILDMTQNRLISLCICEALLNSCCVDFGNEEDWEEHRMPSGETLFFNKITRSSTRKRPLFRTIDDPWSVEIPGDAKHHLEELTSSEPPTVPELKLMTSQREEEIIALRKSDLAGRNMGTWSCELDLTSGHVCYINNVYRRRQKDMPEDTDLLGKLQSLKTIKASGNNLHDIPSSVKLLEDLRHLDLSSNRLEIIDESILELSNLEFLSLGDNIITEIPANIGRLTNLMTLRLQKNKIASVPESLSKLKKMEVLWLMDNQIAPFGIPSALMSLRNLKELHLGDNDLIEVSNSFKRAGDTPSVALRSLGEGKFHLSELALTKSMEQITKNGRGSQPRREVYAKFLWHLREQAQREQIGQPPVVKHVREGIQSENKGINFRMKREETEAILAAQASGTLRVHWKGANRISPAILSLGSCLKELFIVGNHLTEIPSQIQALSSLEVLELRSNAIIDVNEELGKLPSLRRLQLDDNSIHLLPESLGRLQNLEVLSINGNKLETLPESLGGLQSLKKLYANVNKLKFLPESCKHLESLEILQLNNNCINDFPVMLCDLPSLTILHLNLNFIESIPETACNFEALKVLQLSSNRLKFFPPEVCKEPLVNCLESLWLYSNEIVELCDAFVNFNALKDLRVDFNRMISPPEDFALQEGVAGVKKYCQLRASRTKRVSKLLTEAGFEFCKQNFRPRASHVLQGASTGFLTREILATFDHKLDQYLNGQIFEHPGLSAKAIVDEVSRKRAEQHQLFMDALLREYLILMQYLEREGALCSPCFFNPNVKRAWGRQGQILDCYALRLNALFEDQTDPRQRAIVDLLEENTDFRFAEIVFQGQNFRVERSVLENALDNFRDPFHGASAASSAFVRFQPFRDAKGVIIDSPHSAAVVPKMIFTVEESQRCAEEKKDLANIEKKALAELRTWFSGIDYRNRVKLQLKRLRRIAKKRIIKGEADIDDKKHDVKEAEINLERIDKRMAALQRGGLFTVHRFQNLGEAEETRRKALLELERLDEEVRKKKQELKELQEALNATPLEAENFCKESLTKKVFKRRKRFLVLTNRIEARKNGLRRPWDGENGSTFQHWCDELASLQKEEEEMQAQLRTTERRSSLFPKQARKQIEELRKTLEAVAAEKERLFRVESVHNHPFGWSSEETDAETERDEFEFDFETFLKDDEKPAPAANDDISHARQMADDLQSGATDGNFEKVAEPNGDDDESEDKDAFSMPSESNDDEN